MIVKINNEWYCDDCITNHNCTNCKAMIKFIKTETRQKVDIIIGESEENINKTNIPACWDCWEKMLENKSKKWPAYWCPCNKE